MSNHPTDPNQPQGYGPSQARQQPWSPSYDPNQPPLSAPQPYSSQPQPYAGQPQPHTGQTASTQPYAPNQVPQQMPQGQPSAGFPISATSASHLGLQPSTGREAPPAPLPGGPIPAAMNQSLPEQVPTPPPALERPNSPKKKSPWLWIGLAIGVAAIIVGIIAAILLWPKGGTPSPSPTTPVVSASPSASPSASNSPSVSPSASGSPSASASATPSASTSPGNTAKAPAPGTTKSSAEITLPTQVGVYTQSTAPTIQPNGPVVASASYLYNKSAHVFTASVTRDAKVAYLSSSWSNIKDGSNYRCGMEGQFAACASDTKDGVITLKAAIADVKQSDLAAVMINFLQVI